MLADGASTAHLPSGENHAQNVRRECEPGRTFTVPSASGTRSRGLRARNAAFVIAVG